MVLASGLLIAPTALAAAPGVGVRMDATLPAVEYSVDDIVGDLIVAAGNLVSGCPGLGCLGDLPVEAVSD